jgi:methyltransferase (TIGR00027 family)
MAEMNAVGSTAMGAAFQRLAHLVVDGEPKIFVDSLAQRLLALSDEDVVRARMQISASTSGWVLRSRYAEDRLADAASRGVSQYVILGAGLDTFAYRAPGPLAAVRVFEVDTPASQSWKRNRLAEVNIAVPPTCVFVACDFETQSLAEVFAQSSFEGGKPAFVSWLGVTQYLNRSAIVETLRWIAGLGEATEIVITYCVPDARSDPSVRIAEQMGAPFLSLFATDDMVNLLHETGFAATRPLTLEEARATYFTGRTDGLDVWATERLIWARVKPL